MQNKLSIEQEDDCLVVRFSGELDHLMAFRYKESLCKAIDQFASKYVIFDFERITFIDSSGIGLILGRYNQMLEHGGHLVLSGIHPQCEKLFRISGIFTILPHYATTKDAKQEVK